MSDRSGIVKAMASEMAILLDGTGDYINNVFGNVTNKVTHFDSIINWPYISVTPGPESREDMPSNFTWGYLTVFIRIYVRDPNDAQGSLESLITDVEKYLDTHLNLSYNVTTAQGVVERTTTTNTITGITTDEGLLDPDALGEVVVTVQYEKQRNI